MSFVERPGTETAPGQTPAPVAWAAATALLLALLVASLLTARGARARGGRARTTFQSSLDNLASTLELEIQHETYRGRRRRPDRPTGPLRRRAPGLADAAPGAGRALPRDLRHRHLSWSNNADLPAFAAQAEAEPQGQLSRTPFAVVPARTRPSTAWPRAAVSHGEPARLRGTTLRRPARHGGPARRSRLRQGAYLPFPSEGVTRLAVQTPIYQGWAIHQGRVASGAPSPAGSAPRSTRPCCSTAPCRTPRAVGTCATRRLTPRSSSAAAPT